MAHPVTLRLSEAKAIADLARLVLLAADEGASEEFICERFRMLKYAIPEDHILARMLALHDRPGFRRNMASSIADLALAEANGKDISLPGATPEVRAVIERTLADRQQVKES